MLVLTRKPGESIVIGDDIVLTVVAVGRGRVRLGVTAPRNVSIQREELGAQATQGERELGGETRQVDRNARPAVVSTGG